MCGICGFAGSGSRSHLERMAGLLAHRGPDAAGYYEDPGQAVFLGHRRLSIIDLAGGGQPMLTPDERVVVVFNGEIYNHVELRQELIDAGRVFSSHHSDTEVLLHGWLEWGRDLPARLNGMWAFALYDRAMRTLFLSRDRFGKKPLYYSRCKDAFVFASELTALAAHPEVSTEISERALEKYFAYGFIPAPHALYASARKLPAGCSLEVDLASGGHEVHRYWEFVLEPFEERPRNAEALWCERIVELLDQAVKRRLMSDVPLGVFLSGGMDSSSVTAMACRHLPPGGCRTLSIGFEEASFDESDYALQVARHFRTAHHHRTFRASDAYDLLPAVAKGLDEPLGDSSILPTYLLCGEARTQVTVALGGDGADELFAGYDPFRALRLARAYTAVTPRPLHWAVSLMAARLPVSHSYMSTTFRIQRALLGVAHDRALWNPVWLGPVAPKEIAELLERPVNVEQVYEEAVAAWDALPQGSLVDRTLMFYTRLYLTDDILAKVDRASMLHSLEVRSPYLDANFVDFVRRIPWQYKLRGGRTKHILRKALGKVLPANILSRSKQGFAMPVGKLFQQGVIGFPPGNAVPHLNSAFVTRKLDRHLKRKADNRLFLWNAWMLNGVLDAMQARPGAA